MDFAVTACTVVVCFPTTRLSYDSVADYLLAFTDHLGQPERPVCEFVRAYQLMPDKSSARITFRSPHLVSEAVEFSAVDSTSGDLCIALPVIPRRKVVLRYLPTELSVAAVNTVLAKYGTVLSHVFCTAASVPTGTREIEMDLRENIPSTLSIVGHQALVYYSDQQRTCFSCGQTSHAKKDCPTAPKKKNDKPIVSSAPPGPELIHSSDNSVLTNVNPALCSSVNCLVKSDLVSPNLTDISPTDSTLLKSAVDTAQFVESVISKPLPILSIQPLGSDSSEPPESSDPLVSIHVRYLPFELCSSAISDVFSNYGTIVQIKDRSVSQSNKVFTGSRIIEMFRVRPIPSDLYVLGHPCVVTTI